MMLLVLICTSAFADIRQTHDMQVIKKEVFSSPQDTLVVFDIDFVLITPNDNVFLLTATEEGQKVKAKIYDDLWGRLPKNNVDEIHSILITTQTWRPLTPDTALIFNQIKSAGYKVLGLTASSTGKIGTISSLEHWRFEQLKNIGITFSDRDFVNAKPGSFNQYIPNITKYYNNAKPSSCLTGYNAKYSSPGAFNGIIFTTYVPKGDALHAYLKFAEIKPKKIIFIDDRLPNLESVQQYCSEFGIEYIGYEYTEIKEQIKELQPNVQRAKLQYKILELAKVWLDDTEADVLLASLK